MVKLYTFPICEIQFTQITSCHLLENKRQVLLSDLSLEIYRPLLLSVLSLTA